MTSSAILPASRPTRVASSSTRVEVQALLLGDDRLPGDVLAGSLVEILQAGLFDGEEDVGAQALLELHRDLVLVADELLGAVLGELRDRGTGPEYQ
jgi:hypothetical protein